MQKGVQSLPGRRSSGVVEAAAEELAALVLALVGGVLGGSAVVRPLADDILVLVRVRADAAVAVAVALRLGLDADLRRGAQDLTNPALLASVDPTVCAGCKASECGYRLASQRIRQGILSLHGKVQQMGQRPLLPKCGAHLVVRAAVAWRVCVQRANTRATAAQAAPAAYIHNSFQEANRAAAKVGPC